MAEKTNRKIWGGCLTLLYGMALYFFYIKYVPLTSPFQISLLPLLVIVSVVTAINIGRGLLVFIFLFPLINNLPYFFKIFETTPHAPTALVLFLFFFLGWLIHQSFSDVDLSFDLPILRPIVLFSILIGISALLTFFRYSNFYPLRSDSIYELQTNAFGVTAGGAIMSVIFSSLTYISGFVFFFILLQAMKSADLVKKAIVSISASTSLALGFGIWQHLRNIEFGNNPISIEAGLINATFKDALSFGAYLSIIIPFLLGLCLVLKGFYRLWSLVLLVSAGYAIFFTGSKSALLSLAASLIIFLFFLIKVLASSTKPKMPRLKRGVLPAVIVLTLIISASLFLVVAKKPPLEGARKSTTLVRMKDLKSMLLMRTNKFWKISLLMMRDYPVSGAGIGSYIIESSNYAKSLQIDIGIPQSAENLMLQIGSELGLVGVVLFIWILWEIARRARKAAADSALTNAQKVLWLASCAGVVTFLANTLSHTYIWSYEIHYTFWLMTGLVFCLIPLKTGPAEKGLFSRRYKILGAAVIILSASALLWNSTHSLSLKKATERFAFQHNFGLDKPEITKDGREFRWSGRNAGLTIAIEKPVLVIPLQASHPDIRGHPVKVKIYLIKGLFQEKRLMGEVELKTNLWENHVFAVPEEIHHEVLLLIKVSRTWNPLKVLGVPDSRDLGVAVGKIEFKDEK